MGGTCAGLSSSDDGSGNGEASAGAIDRTFLARFTLGNVELEEEVLRLFADQAPSLLEQLRAASTAKAWRDAAHTIKGTAAAVGAKRLASSAEMAERVGPGSPSDEARERALSAVAAALQEACEYVDRTFPPRSG